MCGRYTQTASVKELRERFGLAASEVPELRPRYNLAPTQDAPVIVEDRGRALRMFRWGLIPPWAKDAASARTLINARAETLAEKPSFREAFAARRCLVVADGFYEWRRDPGGKQPLRFVLPSRAPFALAGLWESWKTPEGRDLRTFAIVTTGADEIMRPVHDRMPVVLRREDEAVWLDPSAPVPELAKLLAPRPSGLTAYAVSPLVNSPKNESPACAEPA